MSVHYRFLAAALLVAALVTGCGPDKSTPGPQSDGGTSLEDAGTTDAGTTDAGTPPPPPPVEPDGGPVPPVPGSHSPDNATIDTDCDGLTDAEEWGNVYPGGLRTNPGVRDSDG